MLHIHGNAKKDILKNPVVKTKNSNYNTQHHGKIQSIEKFFILSTPKHEVKLKIIKPF